MYSSSSLSSLFVIYIFLVTAYCILYTAYCMYIQQFLNAHKIQNLTERMGVCEKKTVCKDGKKEIQSIPILKILS